MVVVVGQFYQYVRRGDFYWVGATNFTLPPFDQSLTLRVREPREYLYWAPAYISYINNQKLIIELNINHFSLYLLYVDMLILYVYFIQLNYCFEQIQGSTQHREYL